MRLRGTGIGSAYFGIGNTGMANPSSAFVEVHEDGSASVSCGAADMGQGAATVLAQIVATALDVPVDRVAVAGTDTMATPNAGVSSASRQTYVSGNACLLAAEQVRDFILREAATLLACDSPEQLVLENGFVQIAGEPEARVSVREVASSCRARGRLLVGSGTFNPDTVALDPETGQGEPYGTYAFAAHVAEVDVDTETGEVTVLRVRAAHDVGRAINPQSAEGQIEGGVAMGCGYATMEEVVVESGHVLTKTFVEYSIPTFLDVPRIEPILIEEPASSGPYGAKGLGEPPVCCTPAAILNAVFDATGVRMTRLPLSAENVYLALQAVGYRDGQPPDGLLAHVQRRATTKAPKGSPGGNVAVRATAQDTLAGALDLGPRELISLVGGGGKTSALCLLARELTAAGHRVIVATTTAMFLKELVGVGPLVLEPGGGVLTADLRKALSRGRVAAAAQSPDEAGKVVGLLPGTVDGLWAEGFVDYLIVEADGSRGKSLKAFGPHEPQIPLVTTTIVQVAGLDAIGNPLTGEYVHRAAVLAAALGIPLGSEVTARVFADGLREQLRRLRRAWEGSRVVTLLNKADGPDAEGLGLDVARELLLLALRSGNSVRPGDGERPDTVVLASLQEGRFARVSAIEG